MACVPTLPSLFVVLVFEHCDIVVGFDVARFVFEVVKGFLVEIVFADSDL